MSPWLIVNTGWPGIAMEAGRVIGHAGTGLQIAAAAAAAPGLIALSWVAARRRRSRTGGERSSVS